MSVNKLTEFDKVKKDLEELGREYLKKLTLTKVEGSVKIKEFEEEMIEKAVKMLDASFKEYVDECLLSIDETRDKGE
jgi:nitrogen regulatory protein PII